MTKYFSKLSLGISCAFLSTIASGFSAGYMVFEQNASAFGTGYAGASTSIQDPSTIFYNPAGLAQLKGSQASALVHLILPSSPFKDKGSFAQLGARKTSFSGGNGGDAGESAWVPNLYASHQLNDRVYFGLGITCPFGLATKYKGNWIGRYFGIKSELKTININPVVSLKVNDTFSIGGGITVQYAEAKLTSAIDFGGLHGANVPGSPFGSGKSDGLFKLKGDDWGVGFNVGALYQPTPDSRIGLSFRSSVSTQLSGDATYKRSAAGDILSTATKRFVNTKAKANLTTPEMIIFGVAHDIAPQWKIMADVAWTYWKRFKELRIRFKNPAENDFVDEQNWKNAWRFALGTQYEFCKGWVFKLGGGIDQSPTRRATRSPRIPDAHRTFLTGGIGYLLGENVSVDLGYGHFFFDKAKINLKKSFSGALAPLSHNLKGTLKPKVDIVNAQVTFRF